MGRTAQGIVIRMVGTIGLQDGVRDEHIVLLIRSTEIPGSPLSHNDTASLQQSNQPTMQTRLETIHELARNRTDYPNI